MSRGAGASPVTPVSPVAGIVLDLDGTLLDHDRSVRAALAGWFPELGVEVDEDLVVAWFAAEERHFATWRTGEISFAEQRRRRLRDVLPLLGRPVGDPDELDEAFAGYVHHYERCWTGFDDAVPAVDALVARGLPIAVLTNGAEDQQRAKLAALGLLDRVDAVVTAGALGFAKPDHRTYAAACERLGLPPARVVHVGDVHELDVAAPRRAGLQAVHLDRDGAGPAGEASRITSLLELPAWLDGRPA